MHYCDYYLQFMYFTLKYSIKYKKNPNKINEYNKNVSNVITLFFFVLNKMFQRHCE